MKTVSNLEIQHQCENCEMRDDNYFCNLRNSNMKFFEALKITNAYPKGAMIFMQGQHSNGVFILCQGRVKLTSYSKDGKAIILHIAEAGEILGLSSTITDSIHIATAEAIEPCQLNFIRNKDFLTFLQQNAEACLNAVKHLSKKNQKAYLQICSLGLSNSVADKLALLFLSWCKASCLDHQGIHLKISYTHEEIAQMIGTSRETVTRLLKDFKDKHLISIEKDELIIHDRDKLESSIGHLKNNNHNKS